MKHPDNIGAYYGGHLDGYLPFGLVESSSDDVGIQLYYFCS